jgi:hypothetical protein
MKKIIFTLLCLVSIDYLTAQSITIKGTVRDATSGNSLPGATLLLPALQSVTVSDIQGRFLLESTVGLSLFS